MKNLIRLFVIFYPKRWNAMPLELTAQPMTLKDSSFLFFDMQIISQDSQHKNSKINCLTWRERKIHFSMIHCFLFKYRWLNAIKPFQEELNQGMTYCGIFSICRLRLIGIQNNLQSADCRSRYRSFRSKHSCRTCLILLRLKGTKI